MAKKAVFGIVTSHAEAESLVRSLKQVGFPPSDVSVLKKRRPLVARRLYLAWRLYIGLNYSWRLAWHKAAYERAL